MKNFLLFPSFALAAFVGLSSAFAGPLVSGGIGPSNTYAECVGQLVDGTAVTLVIRDTAVPTYIQGLLVYGDNFDSTNLKCTKAEEPQSGLHSGSADMTYPLWNCVESRSGEGKISVTVSGGGITGWVIGQITQAQMFPLQPYHLGTVVCKNK